MKLSEAQFRRAVLDKNYISEFDLTIVKRILDWIENSWFSYRNRLVVLDEKNGDSEVDPDEFIQACSMSISEKRVHVLWLPGKYWSDEPGTMVLEILDNEGEITELQTKLLSLDKKELFIWPFKE